MSHRDSIEKMSSGQKVIYANSVEDLNGCATELAAFAGAERIWLFYGEMGAGKTTLIKAICEVLGAAEPVTSPTFSIVNEYSAATGKIFHFDFYRLKNETEALDLGYEEYFYSGDYCLIEWPEKISGLLPEHYLRISIGLAYGVSREIKMKKIRGFESGVRSQKSGN
jgi:tRNA threonylcarbamoyladenosine biosynthesis protein TsaE